MLITKKLTAKDTLRELSPQEMTLAQNILKKNLLLNEKNSLLIISDPTMLEKEAALWFEAAKKIGANVTLVVLSEMTHSGEEPPEEIVEMVKQHDVSIFQTVFSLTHTRAGKAVAQLGKRGASMPGADYELIMRTLNLDYTPVKELGEKLKHALESAQKIRVTSDSGTDLIADIRQNAVYNDAGFFEAGDIGNLPAGEVFFAPLLGSSNGSIVIDGSIADDELDEPIRLEIENGVIVKFEGGKAAANLEKLLSQFDLPGLTLAEIGIGTNSAAQISPNLLEAEKAYGTVHIAFGNSSAIGGENDVPIHIDGLVAKPTVMIDEKLILQNKTFSID